MSCDFLALLTINEPRMIHCLRSLRVPRMIQRLHSLRMFTCTLQENQHHLNKNTNVLTRTALQPTSYSEQWLSGTEYATHMISQLMQFWRNVSWKIPVLLQQCLKLFGTSFVTFRSCFYKFRTCFYTFRTSLLHYAQEVSRHAKKWTRSPQCRIFYTEACLTPI